MTGIDQHVLRYWESEFEELRPRKNRAGRRVYTEDDIAVLERIHKLLRDDKYTIEGARQVLARDEPAKETHAQLQALRTFLTDVLEKLGPSSG